MADEYTCDGNDLGCHILAGIRELGEAIQAGLESVAFAVGCAADDISQPFTAVTAKEVVTVADSLAAIGKALSSKEEDE